MSDLVYPAYPAYRGLAFTVMRAPEFSTIVQRAPGAVESRLLRIQNPRWHWTLQYNYLKDNPVDLPENFDYSDFKTLLAFILRHKGRYEDFLLRDPDDEYVGPALILHVPNTNAQLQLIQDEITGIWYSPIQRNMGGQFYEDIADINGAITLYADGTFQEEADYVIGGPGLGVNGYSFAGLYAQWTVQPVTPITAEFYYYWRVRFDSDKQDMDKFMRQLWAIGGPQGEKGEGTVKLVSVRNGSSGYTGGYPSPPYPTTYDECAIEVITEFPDTQSIPSPKFIGQYEDEIFILDRTYTNGHVYVYRTDGTFLRVFQTTIEETSPNCENCMAIGPDYVYVSAGKYGQPSKTAIAKFTHAGAFVGSIPTYVGLPNWEYGSFPLGMCFYNGYLYAATNYGLEKYTAEGDVVWQVQHYGIPTIQHPDYFFTVYSLTADGDYVYVYDYSYHSILKYSDVDGSYVSKIGGPWGAIGLSWRNSYLFATEGWGVVIYDRATLQEICSATMLPPYDWNDIALDPLSPVSDGSYLWGLGTTYPYQGNPPVKVLKVAVHVIGERIIGAPPLPRVSFGAYTNPIFEGEKAYLHWSITHAGTQSISPDVGSVASSGELEVSISETTLFTLSGISNYGDPVLATCEVVVNPLPPQPVGGLWGYWKFEEASGDRIDATGNGNRFIPESAMGNTTGIIGNGIQFAAFDGIDAEAGPDLRDNVHFLYALWAKPHIVNNTSIRRALDIGSDVEIELMQNTGQSKYYIGVYAGDLWFDTAEIYDPDQLNLIVLYFDGIGLYLEVNNTLAGFALGYTNIGEQNPIYAFISRDVSCMVDEMGIWTGQAADAKIADRDAIWNNGAGSQPI